MAAKNYLSPLTWVRILFSAELGKWVESPRALRRFVLAVALCGVAYAANAVISEIRPYNAWGLTYGALAALFMLAATLLGWRRRANRVALKLGLGKAQSWLQFHLYGGLLALVLMFMHSGFHLPTGILTWCLWLLSIWVTLSGLFGVFLQKWIPKLLSSGLAMEVIYDRVPELIVEIREKANMLMQTCTDPLKEFYRKNVAFALTMPQPRLIYYLDITGGIHARLKQFDYLREFLPAGEKEKLDKLETFYKSKLEIDAHYTLQRALRWWLYTHVPLSLILLVFLGLHLFTVLYY